MTQLPNLPRAQFAPIGGGGPTIGGGGYPTGGPIQINLPPRGGGSGGVVIPVGGGSPSSSTSVSATSVGFLGSLFSFGTDWLLRLVLLILGIICIIGAIYLFKPTTEIVAPLVRTAKAAAAVGE